MKNDFTISFFLDIRRVKHNGKHPVKLRLYSSYLNKGKLISMNLDYSKQEFENIWKTNKPKRDYFEARLKLQAMQSKANEIAKSITPFSFEEFIKRFFKQSSGRDNLVCYYESAIQHLKENNQLGNASNYELSLKSLKEFLKVLRGKEPDQISFSEITPSLLQKYETYMVQTKQRSSTTVAMYLRALRTVFNNAIASKEIDKELYPFGKLSEKKYTISSVRSVKKALNKDLIKKVYEITPRTDCQEKAKDFWFFIYSCYGINTKDICLLKFENIKDDMIVFYRAKTLQTSKRDLSPIKIVLTDYAKSVIVKYGNKDKSPKNYIFPILNDSMSSLDKFRAIKNFSIFINKHLQKMLKAEGINTKITTYTARHSFATNIIRSGASMEFVSEALGHKDLRTTQIYFAGFEDDSKKELMKTLMDFK